MKNIKFSFDDILLTSETITTIQSRKQQDVNPYINGGLPIFTAPMLDVINLRNMNLYRLSDIKAILPRVNKISALYDKCFPFAKDTFISLSLDQFQVIFNLKDNIKIDTSIAYRILIDVANGHMKHLHDAVIKAKKLYPNLIIMIGNISNPKTVKYFVENSLPVDYLRIGVGNGSACTTANNTSIGYPQASLIYDCYQEVKDYKNRPLLISDGGHKNFGDITKALALGADYVMIGGQFSNLLESSGDNLLFKKIKISSNLARKLFKKLPVYKRYRGMSTQSVQKVIGNGKLRTAEGVTKYNKITGTLKEWVNEFDDHLRSTMSYLNARTLEELKESDFNFISKTSFERLQK